MLKPLLINTFFQTWHLIGGRHSRQAIRRFIRKFLLTCILALLFLSKAGPLFDMHVRTLVCIHGLHSVAMFSIGSLYSGNCGPLQGSACSTEILCMHNVFSHSVWKYVMHTQYLGTSILKTECQTFWKISGQTLPAGLLEQKQPSDWRSAVLEYIGLYNVWISWKVCNTKGKDIILFSFNRPWLFNMLSCHSRKCRDLNFVNIMPVQPYNLTTWRF